MSKKGKDQRGLRLIFSKGNFNFYVEVPGNILIFLVVMFALQLSGVKESAALVAAAVSFLADLKSLLS